MDSINLNLIKTLESLFRTKNLTYSAIELDVSQASISINLKQLRAIYNDPLLVKGKGRLLSLTPLAELIKPEVISCVMSLDKIFHPCQEFIPTESNNTFHIACTDLVYYHFLPNILKEFDKKKYTMKLKLHTPSFIHPTELFENNKYNLVIGSFVHETQSTLLTQLLLSDDIVLLGRKEHPIFKNDEIKAEHLAPYHFVLQHEIESPHRNFLDRCFQKIGADISVSITASTTLALVFWTLAIFKD